MPPYPPRAPRPSRGGSVGRPAFGSRTHTNSGLQGRGLTAGSVAPRTSPRNPRLEPPEAVGTKAGIAATPLGKLASDKSSARLPPATRYAPGSAPVPGASPEAGARVSRRGRVPEDATGRSTEPAWLRAALNNVPGTLFAAYRRRSGLRLPHSVPAIHLYTCFAIYASAPLAAHHASSRVRTGHPRAGHHLADDDHGHRPSRCAHVMHDGRPVTWTLPFRCQNLTPAARPCARPKPMSTLHAARSPTQGYPFRDRIVSPPCITCYAQPRKPPYTRVSSRKRFTFPHRRGDAPP